MKFSIMFCHFKTGKMSAYTIAQLLKYKGNHEIEILISNNNPGDGSERYFEPFKNNIRLFDYPSNVLQSHGCGYNFLMEYASNEYVIAMESDSFPVKEGWLDYYVNLIHDGYDCAGSLLKLSGGEYVHPAGCLYRRSLWVKAWLYCREIEYTYFPNMSMREGFQCHLMVHKSIINEFLSEPDDYIELADGYKPFSKKAAIEKAKYYSSVVGPMHNGMGGQNESIHTYGKRNRKTEAPTILLNNKAKLLNRIGYEPGQWFYYWQLANGFRIFEVPTEIKWLLGKENQQQEYTLMENGFKHLWGISAYHGTDLNDGDVAKVKQTLPEQLYETLPDHQKI